MRIDVDPTELLPGDIVISLSEHDEGGCHCDVRVCVERRTPEKPRTISPCECGFQPESWPQVQEHIQVCELLRDRDR